jgi:hypothetical protein
VERISLQARRERLSPLVTRVGPVAFARERVMPISAALEPLLPEAGLVRGSIVGCQGDTSMSVALAVVAEASAAGSWLAVVGLPALGLRAASEVGVALERLVMVAQPDGLDESSWANVVSALIDGFDLILLRSTPRLRAGTARRLQARVQARGAVLVVVGDPGQFGCDVTISTLAAEWEGLGHGSGRLLRRRVTLATSGRRIPRQRRVDVWLPGHGGGIEAAADLAKVIDLTELQETG